MRVLREARATLVGVLLAAGVVAGCGGDDPAPPAVSSAPTTTATSPATPAPAQQSTPTSKKRSTPGKGQTLGQVLAAEARIPLAMRRAAAKVARRSTRSCLDAPRDRHPTLRPGLRRLSRELQDAQRALIIATKTAGRLRRRLGTEPKTPDARVVLALAQARMTFVRNLNYAMERGSAEVLGHATASVERSSHAMVEAGRRAKLCKPA